MYSPPLTALAAPFRSSSASLSLSFQLSYAWSSVSNSCRHIGHELCSSCHPKSHSFQLLLNWIYNMSYIITLATMKYYTSQGFRHGGWKVCLQGNSCILSFTAKFSLQMQQSASSPSFFSVSSVIVITGRFATTFLLAGGTLGVPLMSSKIPGGKTLSRLSISDCSRFAALSESLLFAVSISGRPEPEDSAAARTVATRFDCTSHCGCGGSRSTVRCPSKRNPNNSKFD